MSAASITTPPPPEDRWEATKDSPATTELILHGILGEDKCTYFPDYPNLFVLPESNELCGYVHALDDADKLRATPHATQIKSHTDPTTIQPPTVPVRPRGAFLGRSGPRQDLELLRRNLNVQAECANKLRAAEEDEARRREEVAEQQAAMAKQAQRQKEQLMKEIREQFDKEMDKLRKEIEDWQAKYEEALQLVEEEKAKGVAKLAKQKQELEEQFAFQLEEALELKELEIQKLQEELATWPPKVEAAIAETEARCRAEAEVQRLELLKKCEATRKSQLEALVRDTVLNCEALVGKVKEKGEELAAEELNVVNMGSLPLVVQSSELAL